MRAEWRLRRVRDGSVEELPFPMSPQGRAAQELVGGTREVEGSASVEGWGGSWGRENFRAEVRLEVRSFRLLPVVNPTSGLNLCLWL